MRTAIVNAAMGTPCRMNSDRLRWTPSLSAESTTMRLLTAPRKVMLPASVLLAARAIQMMGLPAP